MSDIISGEIIINGEKYPFVLKNRKIELIGNGLYSSTARILIPTELFGITNNGNSIVFLMNEELAFSPFVRVTRLNLLGYVLLNKYVDILNYDELVFFSNSLNVLSPPMSAVKYEFLPDRHLWDGRLNVSISSRGDTKKTYENISHKQRLIFDFTRTVKFNSRDILEVIPYIKVAYEEEQNASTLIYEWLKIYDFLCFLTFRKDIFFDKILLQHKNKEIGTLVVFSGVEESSFDSKAHQVIGFYDIPDKKFVNLFNNITEIRNSDIDNYHFIPETKKDDRMIDNSKWAMNALNFEMIFQKEYNDFKSTSKNEFAEVKTSLLEFLNISKDGASKKKIKYLEQFEKVISHEGRLSEKFSHFINEYKNELQPTIDLLTKNHGLNANLGELYAKKRNNVMHGKLEKPNDIDIGIYKLIRAMYYAYILRKSNFESSRTADIIERLFARYN